MLRLHTLGALTLQRDDGSTVPLQRRPLALLALIAAAGPRGVTREKVLALLWPDADEERGRHALAQTLYTVRRACAADVIVGTPTLRLDDATVSSDVAELESAIRAGDPERAAALYTGPFLDGFTLPNADEFDRCIDDERRRVGRRAGEAMETSAARAAARGNMRAAAEWWRRRAGIDPLDARVALALIESLAQCGDVAGALQHADTFQTLRRTELDLAPDARVAAAAARVRAAERGSTDLAAAPAPTREASGNASRDRTHPTAVPPAPQDAATPGGAAERETTRDVPADLRHEPAPGRYRGHALVWGGVLVAVAVVVVVGGFLLRPARPLDTRRVVVAVLQNRTADTSLAPLGDMAADWVSGELARTGVVDVVDSRAVIGSELGPDARASASGTVAQMRDLARSVGAGIMVWGTYYRRGDTLEFDSQVTDVRDGATLRTITPVLTSVADPMTGLKRLSSRVMGALATVEDPRLEEWTERGGSPPTYEAYREFVAGLRAHVHMDDAEALAHYQRAAALDSTFLQPLLFGADAQRSLGQSVQAESTLARVAAARDRLIPADRLLLEFQLAQLRAKPDQAYQAAREMARLSPTSQSFVIAGQGALYVGRPREALQWYRRVNPNLGWVKDWVEYWYEATMAAHLAGDDQEALRFARGARRAHPEQLASYACLIPPLAATGQMEALTAVLDSAALAPGTDGWRYDELLNTAASELAAHGRPDLGRQVWQHALAWYATRPAERSWPAEMRDQHVRILLYLGRAAEAVPYARALAADRPGDPTSLGTLGVALAAAGDADGARAIDSRLAALSDRAVDATARAAVAAARARIAAQLGDRDAATTDLQAALAGQAASPFDPHRSADFRALRGYPPFQQLAQARD